jgi:hypothetical protein
VRAAAVLALLVLVPLVLVPLVPLVLLVLVLLLLLLLLLPASSPLLLPVSAGHGSVSTVHVHVDLHVSSV